MNNMNNNTTNQQRPTRRDLFRNIVQRITQIEDLDADDRICSICRLDYGETDVPDHEDKRFFYDLPFNVIEFENSTGVSSLSIPLELHEVPFEDSDGKIWTEHTPVRLPCGHVYGHDCITVWMAEHIDCPLCRRPQYDSVRSLTSESEFEIVKYLDYLLNEDINLRLSCRQLLQGGYYGCDRRLNEVITRPDYAAGYLAWSIHEVSLRLLKQASPPVMSGEQGRREVWLSHRLSSRQIVDPATNAPFPDFQFSTTNAWQPTSLELIPLAQGLYDTTMSFLGEQFWWENPSANDLIELLNQALCRSTAAGELPTPSNRLETLLVEQYVPCFIVRWLSSLKSPIPRTDDGFSAGQRQALMDALEVIYNLDGDFDTNLEAVCGRVFDAEAYEQLARDALGEDAHVLDVLKN